MFFVRRLHCKPATVRNKNEARLQFLGNGEVEGDGVYYLVMSPGLMRIVRKGTKGLAGCRGERKKSTTVRNKN